MSERELERILAEESDEKKVNKAIDQFLFCGNCKYFGGGRDSRTGDIEYGCTHLKTPIDICDDPKDKACEYYKED